MMKKKNPHVRPNDENTRFIAGRAPNALDDHESPLDTENQAPKTVRLLSKVDSFGRLTATVGFQLVSCAIPPRTKLHAKQVNEFFAGELELSRDVRAALHLFVSELPVGAAFITEYFFVPAGDGGVEVRLRLLVKSAPLPLSQVLQQVDLLAYELGMCLRILTGWYAFDPVVFSDRDLADQSSSLTSLHVQSRLFTSDSPTPIGFVNSGKGRSKTRVYFPQPITGDLSADGTKTDAQRPLLLHSSGRSVLVSTLRAARGINTPMTIRVCLRRRNLEPASLNAIESVKESVSAAIHKSNFEEQSDLSTGRARGAAQLAVDHLFLQPESLELHVETDGAFDKGRQLLGILGRELVPDFATEVRRNDQSLDSKRRSIKGDVSVDLSQLFAPGSALPPLLPSPEELEALNFPRHFPNPTVVFPSEGLHLGKTQIGGVTVSVRMPLNDRSRHMYVLGATGTGKSTLIYNMAVQDMLTGCGLMVCDPHGDLFEQLLLAVPPDRKGDLVLIDPEDERFCPSLNPLDFGGTPRLEDVSRVANDMMDIFNSLYDMRASGGPGFEDYFG
jgi:hypothetical protein